MTDPTETLDAIEQALQKYASARDFIYLDPENDVIKEGVVFGAGDSLGNAAFDALSHLATLRQQVAELVAFREAHEWRPISDEYKDGRPCLLTNDNWAGYAVAVGQYKPSDEEFIDAGLRLQHVYPPNLCMPLPTPPAAEGGQGA